MNKTFIFQRAWAEHKIKTAHNCPSNFAHCLRRQFTLARTIALATNPQKK